MIGGVNLPPPGWLSLFEPWSGHLSQGCCPLPFFPSIGRYGAAPPRGARQPRLNTAIARACTHCYTVCVPTYLFTSRQDPLVCVVTPDPTGAALPAAWGPWDRTEAPWDGQEAGFVAGVRELLEERVVNLPNDDEPLPTRH
jgi:hypothetical protein